jgi:uncharacterized protein
MMLRRPLRLALVAALPALAPAAAQQQAPEIVAGGEGIRTVPADRASLTVSVETRGPTPSWAGALNATRNTAIRDAIAAVGVPRDDITTAGYMAYRIRREHEPFMRGDTGFVAQNTVRVTIRRPEQLRLLGRVIDTALAAGATHIMGVRFEARRTDEAKREALADAVADARSKAEVIARAAGGSLGELLEVSTQARGIGLRGEFDFSAGGTSARAEMTPVTSGEIEVRQYVTARWRFVAGGR